MNGANIALSTLYVYLSIGLGHAIIFLLTLWQTDRGLFDKFTPSSMTDIVKRFLDYNDHFAGKPLAETLLVCITLWPYIYLEG